MRRLINPWVAKARLIGRRVGLADGVHVWHRSRGIMRRWKAVAGLFDSIARRQFGLLFRC